MVAELDGWTKSAEARAVVEADMVLDSQEVDRQWGN